MKAYLLGSYSPAGLKGLISGGAAGRKAAIDKLSETLNLKILDVAFTRGEFDVTVTFECEDEESALGLAIAVKSSGGFEMAVILNIYQESTYDVHDEKILSFLLSIDLMSMHMQYIQLLVHSCN